MTTNTVTWESKRTEETKQVEDLLKQTYKQVDAYRYNSATIRLRVIDPCFENLSRELRDTKVEEQLQLLPVETQRDIVSLFTFAPSELNHTPMSFKEYLRNSEFEDPSPSLL
jgi:hypothetical protein